MCGMMPMTFKNGYDVVILWQWWHSKNLTEYIISCTVVGSICILSCMLKKLKSISESVELLDAYWTWAAEQNNICHDLGNKENTPTEKAPHSSGFRRFAPSLSPTAR
eukprot:GHVH01017009.1.p1 GENE.GHVH01017009.1~~GHVH01017009.1.p1  ORF type:complete len:107 (+),score=6.07 GHVH01017009.1:118-438(+)